MDKKAVQAGIGFCNHLSQTSQTMLFPLPVFHKILPTLRSNKYLRKLRIICGITYTEQFLACSSTIVSSLHANNHGLCQLFCMMSPTAPCLEHSRACLAALRHLNGTARFVWLGFEIFLKIVSLFPSTEEYTESGAQLYQNIDLSLTHKWNLPYCSPT